MNEETKLPIMKSYFFLRQRYSSKQLCYKGIFEYQTELIELFYLRDTV